MTDEERRLKHNAYIRLWNKKHPGYGRERHTAWQREWRAKNPAKMAEYREKANDRQRRKYAGSEEFRKSRREYEARRRLEPGYRDKQLAYLRAWNQRKKAKSLGITPEQYSELLSRFDGPCEICGIMGKMQIDHDHATNQFRGLLCRFCNTMLGHARDSVDTLTKAIDYLKAHNG